LDIVISGTGKNFESELGFTQKQAEMVGCCCTEFGKESCDYVIGNMMRPALHLPAPATEIFLASDSATVQKVGMNLVGGAQLEMG